MTDHTIKAAREAELLDHRDTVATVPGCYSKGLERFWAIAFAAGMERAAEIAELEGQHQTATLIRAHVQNPAKNVHDTAVMSKK